MPKTILITGASRGFGRLTARTLIKKGHAVVATMRDPDNKNNLVAKELRKNGAHVIEIDVTDSYSVNKGVWQAIEVTGGLDVVINNAGVGVLGLQEAFDIEDWKKLFDINVFGVQRINRAVLPLMRQKKSGTLIFVSSLLGRITMPYYGPYNASKWALEAMAENYRAELSGFGIDVCIVEPGGYATGFVDNLITPSDSKCLNSYGAIAQAPAAMFSDFEKTVQQNKHQNPQLVANKISELIDTPTGKRKFRNPVDKLGMGDPIGEYNEHAEKLTQGLYGNFGMDDMLKVKK